MGRPKNTFGGRERERERERERVREREKITEKIQLPLGKESGRLLVIVSPGAPARGENV